ncbi:MAG: hypothetical protein LBF85_05925 [Tannerella sp.]|jgi:hypothetical protein|nr:hypothetical protein [Tannerella sp.]
MKKQIGNTLSTLNSALKNSDGSAVAEATVSLLQSLDRPQKWSHRQAGIKAANMFLLYGAKAGRRQNAVLLAEIKNSAKHMYSHFPESEKMAHIFLKLVGNLLELHTELRKHDGREHLFDEIRNIAHAFPRHPAIALECSLCYANLQENNIASWNTSPSLTDMIISEQEKISARFPRNNDICRIYCRSLAKAARATQIKLRNWDLFRKYVEMLTNQVETHKIPTSGEIGDFLNAVAPFGI